MYAREHGALKIGEKEKFHAPKCNDASVMKSEEGETVFRARARARIRAQRNTRDFYVFLFPPRGLMGAS